MVVLAGCPVRPEPPKPLPPGGAPNIIFFMSDDQRSDQMLALPAVQQLIRDRGVNFSNAISPVPLCCPARASLLTGQYTHNHGVDSNRSASGGGFDGLNQTNTISRWLHDAGYRTGHIGKYMNGYNRSKALPIGWDEWWAASRNPFLMYDYTLNHNGVEVPFGSAPADYKTDVLTRLAVDFVKKSAPRAQPFYLQVWYTAPHAEEGTDNTGRTFDGEPPRPAPRHAGLYGNVPFPTDPSYNEADLSDKPAWVRALPNLGATRTATLTAKHRTELASLASVDEGVRQIVNALSASGELANTILVFTSDNGNMSGEHRVPFGKGDVYEPSIRVPLYVSGPGFPARRTVPAPVMLPDVTATLVQRGRARAGVALDGRRLEDAIANPAGDRAILIGSGIDTAPEAQFRGVRTKRWVYAEYAAPSDRELYDLATDPHEMQSRHADPARASTRTALQQLLGALSTCAGSSCNVPVPAALR
jgi:arylsulfatase A-like enzyme